MQKIKIKIHLEEGCSIHPSLPTYQSKDAAGCDLCYCGEMPILLQSLDRATIHTGVHIQLPDGYEAQVRGRSGLNRNHGIVVPTGTIDADYRGASVWWCTTFQETHMSSNQETGLHNLSSALSSRRIGSRWNPWIRLTGEMEDLDQQANKKENHGLLVF